MYEEFISYLENNSTAPLSTATAVVYAGLVRRITEMSNGDPVAMKEHEVRLLLKNATQLGQITKTQHSAALSAWRRYASFMAEGGVPEAVEAVASIDRRHGRQTGGKCTKESLQALAPTLGVDAQRLSWLSWGNFGLLPPDYTVIGFSIRKAVNIPDRFHVVLPVGTVGYNFMLDLQRRVWGESAPDPNVLIVDTLSGRRPSRAFPNPAMRAGKLLPVTLPKAAESTS